jgi:iron complex outermembrane receptor protein
MRVGTPALFGRCIHNILRLFLAAALAVLTATTLPARSAAADEPPHLEELSLEQLMEMTVTTVYGASLYRQSTSDAPASVTIVTAEEIKRYGWRTLADVLRAVRSFHVTDDRVYSFVGVRGLQRPGDFNSRVLVQLDGHPTNENLYGGALIGKDNLIDLALVDRIEIIRGPGSSLYGTNAFFGVVNIVTRRGRDLGGAEIAGEAGTHETFAGRLSYGRRYGNVLELLLSGARFDSEGVERLYVPAFDAPETNNGIAEDADGEDDADLFLKLAKGGLTLEGAYSNREKTAPSAPYGTVFNTDRTWVKDVRAFLELRYDGKIGGRGDLAASVFYDSYRYRANYLYDYAPAEEPAFLVDNRDEGDGRWWGARSHLIYPAGNQTLTVGGEFLRHERQDQKNYDTDPNFIYFDDARDSVNWGVFLQDEIRLGRLVILNLGVRYDRYDTFGGTVNPRAALIYHPREATSVKLLYGTAFRAPNNYELYFNSVGLYKANPELDPERITTYEAIVEQRIGSSWQLSVGGFHYRIRDVINLVADPADGLFVYENAGEVKASGAEIELSGRWDGGVQAVASYSYQEVRDPRTDRFVVNSPRHLAKARAQAPLVREKLLLGAEVQYLSARKTVTDDAVGAYTLVNATLSTGKDLFRNLELSLSAFNLFDASFADPTADDFVADRIAQDGRTFLARATVHF